MKARSFLSALFSIGMTLAQVLPVDSALAQGFLPHAPHGGVLKEGEKMNFEVLVGDGQIDIYPFSKMAQPVPTTSLILTGSALEPRAPNKIQPLQIETLVDPPTGTGTQKTSHFRAKVFFHGTFDLTLTAEHADQKETFVFKALGSHAQANIDSESG